VGDALQKVLVKLKKKTTKKQQTQTNKKSPNQTHTLHSPLSNLKVSVYHYPGKLFIQKMITRAR